MDQPVHCGLKRFRIVPCKWIFDDQMAFRLWTVPVVLLIVAVLSYGLYANQLGFYWDDWSYAWTRVFQGLKGLLTFSSQVRPMRPYFEIIFTPILGINPFAWQIYGILLRWLTAVAVWWFLRQVWPGIVRPLFMVALFYLIYPGFSQQSMAQTYHYFLFFLMVSSLSCGLMIRAVRKPKQFWPAMIAALVLSVLNLFSSEYYFGLELLRPFFLWIALEAPVNNWQVRLGRAVRLYFPFALVLGIYLYWRVFIFKFPTYQPWLFRDLQAAPAQTLMTLIQTAIHSLYSASLEAWFKVVQTPVLTSGGARFAAFYPWLVIGCLVGLILYQSRLPIQNVQPAPPESSRKYSRQFIAAGLIGMLTAGLPSYVSYLPVQLGFPYDRFTLAFMLGVSLLLTGILELLPEAAHRVALASVLAALALGVHLYNGYLYRNEWDLQKSFFWQLSWRVPGLEPDTALLSDDQTFPYTDDEGLTFPLNWMYSPENTSDRFDYSIKNISARLGGSLPSLDRGATVLGEYFSAHFKGSTDQVIVYYFNPPSCLRILNPEYDHNIVFLPLSDWETTGQLTIQDVRFLPEYTAEALPLSDPSRVVPDPEQPAAPPAYFFGPEPKHTWCYYFEKADLARQESDWEGAARLGDQALANFVYPKDISEYLVFIEAFTHLKRWGDAQALTRRVTDLTSLLMPSLCAVWQRAEQAVYLSDSERAFIVGMEQELQYCPNP